MAPSGRTDQLEKALKNATPVATGLPLAFGCDGDFPPTALHLYAPCTLDSLWSGREMVELAL